MRAIGMVEFNSIARGIYAADQMVKTSEVEIVTAASTCPGKYIAIVHGDVSAVEESVQVGEKEAGEFYVDSMVIPNVDAGVFPAITGATMPERIGAIGIMESFSISTMIICADQILKAADVESIATDSAVSHTSLSQVMYPLYRQAQARALPSRRRRDFS